VSGRRDSERSTLQAGLAQLGISTGPGQLEGLLAHLELVRQWSASYNLVARGDLDHLLSRHLLDSLALVPWLHEGDILDVGSGAGFPGIPLAIVKPQNGVWLVDSAGKKVRFLRHVIRSLGLANARAVQERVERFSPAHEFSNITSRAFGSVRAFADSVRHLSVAGTRLLAMKGREPARELEALPDWVTVESVQRLEVPGLDAERHLVVMTVAAR